MDAVALKLTRSGTFLVLLVISGCAANPRPYHVGRAVGYSSIYDHPTITVFSSDGTYISSNSDLIQRYSLDTQNGYLFKKNGAVEFFMPSERRLTEGDQWSLGKRSFKLLAEEDGTYLVSSEWLGESLCFDGWKAGMSRILYSESAGLLNITTMQLDCADDAVVGYSLTNFYGGGFGAGEPE